MCYDCHILFIRITNIVVCSGRTFCVWMKSRVWKLDNHVESSFHIYCKCFLENIFSPTHVVERKEAILRRIFYKNFLPVPVLQY
jgi:hypothetical protein